MIQSVQDHINNILDVNGSWRESYNEIGCLMAFDYDPMLEGSILADVLMEEHDITEEQAIIELIDFAFHNGYIWTKEIIGAHKAYVIETLNNFGGEGKKDYKAMMKG